SLAPPGDEPDIAVAPDRLIGSAELRASMGRAGRRKIERDADPEAQRLKLVAFNRRGAQHDSRTTTPTPRRRRRMRRVRAEEPAGLPTADGADTLRQVPG